MAKLSIIAITYWTTAIHQKYMFNSHVLSDFTIATSLLAR